MSQIYAGSQGNLVHLTDDDSTAERLVKMIAQVSEEGSHATNEWRDLHKLTWSGTNDARIDVQRVWPPLEFGAG